MKKIDTFQAFARGAKSLVAILLVMLMAVGGLFAQTQQYSLVTEDQSDWSGTYLLVASPTAGENASTVQALTGISNSNTKYGLGTNITDHVTGSIIASNATTDAGAIVITATGTGTYTMNLGEVGYLGWTSGNSLISGESATSDNYKWNITITDGTLIITNANDNTRKLRYNASSPRFACYTTEQTVVNLYKLETATPATVATPTFTPAAGTYYAAQTVAIACATEGAAIYYTIDGTEPTAESVLYNDPIAVNATTTIKAIAVLGEDASAVATATYTINLPVEVANIAAFKAAETSTNNNTVYKITGDVVVLGQYSNAYHTFVQDETGALYIYGTVANTYNPGDVVSGGVYGTYALYNGLVELKPIAALPMAEGVAGTPVEPAVVTVADLIAGYNTYESKLVTIENVTVLADRTFGTTSATRGVKVVQGEDTIQIYNSWGAITDEEVNEGDQKTVTGYLIRYNSNYEIVPRGAADIIDYEESEEPEEPEVPEVASSWVTCEQVGVFNTQVEGLVPTCEETETGTTFHFAYTDAFNGFPEQHPNEEMGGNPYRIYVDVKVQRPDTTITGVKVSYGPGMDTIIAFTEVTDPYNGTLGDPYYAVLSYYPVASVDTNLVVTGNEIERSWTDTIEWYIGDSLVMYQYLTVVVDAAPAPTTPASWVSCEQVDVFNTQVNGLVPTCTATEEETVFHFAYNNEFSGYPTQTPSEEMGGNPYRIYVDVMVKRPNADITGVKVSYGPGMDTIIAFTEVTDPFNGTLGDPYDAVLSYYPVASVDENGVVTGNATERSWTDTIEWYIGEELAMYQYLTVVVDAAPVAETSWVSCEQVDVFNTQVDGLTPTCSTNGEETVYHFVYDESFAGYPAQTPSEEMGGNPSKVYVDVMIKRPSEDITGVKVSYGEGHEEIIEFTDVTDPFNGTLGHPYDAILYYFPVATVDTNGNVEGNHTQRSWTVDVEWCRGTFVAQVQQLTVVVDPVPMAQGDVATLPYENNFDQGADFNFVIENGNNTNKWYVGQAQGFDDNKLYISSSNGATNKYDITKTSNVKAYRDVMIPEAGAILSFDYRANGEYNCDYLKVDLIQFDTNNVATATNIAKLSGNNEWNTFTYDITSEMAGVVRVQFNWVNDGNGGNQFPAAVDNIVIIETPCSQPTALAAEVDSTTAVITWVAPEGQTAWNLQYKLADYTEWYTVAATDTFVVLNDLQGNSNYVMRVQAVCGENTSVWVNGSFAVNCQSVVNEPAEITIGTGTSSNNIFPIAGYYNHSYNQQLFTEAELAQNGIIPGSVINSLSFNYTYATSTVRPVIMWLTTSDVVSLSSSFISINEFTQVYSNTCQEFNNSNDGWNTITLDQPFTYTGGSLVLATLMNKESAEDETTCFTTYGSNSRFKYTSNSGKARYYNVDNTTPITFTEEGMPKTTGAALAGTSSANRNNIKFNLVIPNCFDEIACVTPTNLVVSDETYNSAVLSWIAGDAEQTTFVVEYTVEGEDNWTSVEVNDTTYTLTGLEQLTSYSVRVKAVCGENNWSDVIPASFETSAMCASVQDISSYNTANSTTLTWTAGGAERNWLVQFKPQTATDDAWISINVATLPSTTFGGLAESTTYDVRIKALCDIEDEANQSQWTYYNFTSDCAAKNVPYTEAFGYSTPDCWMSEGFNFSGYAYTSNEGAYIVAPSLNIPSENTTYLAFEVSGDSTTYNVMASYRGTREDRFENIYTAVAEDNQRVIIAVPSLYGSRAVNFKFVNVNGGNLNIDNFVVNQCPFTITDLAVDSVNGSMVILSWKSEELAEGFTVTYNNAEGEEVVVPATDTTVTINGLDYNTTYNFTVMAACAGDNGDSQTINVTTAPACSAPVDVTFNEETYTLNWFAGEWGTPAQYNIRYFVEGTEDYIDTIMAATDTMFVVNTDGLLSATQYVIEIQAVCSNEYESEWVSFNFITPCSVMNIPYAQDFDGGEFPPMCWSQEYVEGEQSWVGYNGQAAFPYTPGNETRLLTPVFDLSEETAVLLKFSHRQPTYGGVQDELSVYYRVHTDSAWVMLVEYTDAIPEMVEEEILVPAAALTSSCQFAFVGHANDGNNIYLDDIELMEAPTCGTPTIALSSTTVVITPATYGNIPVAYEVQLNEMSAITTNDTVDLASLFTLELSTNYTVTVRTVCGADDTSEVSNAISFTTPQCWEFCAYTVRMNDSYGDGWNDCAVYVMVDGVQTQSLTISDGASNTETAFICSGEVSFVWHTGGYPGEASFTIEDAEGNTVYTCTSGSNLTDGQEVYNTYCGTLVCGKPTLAVSGTELSITPNAIATTSPIAYELNVGEETYFITDSIIGLDTLFTSLEAGAYTVNVRAICSETDTSDWTSANFIMPFSCSGIIDDYEITGTTVSTSYVPSYSLYNYSLTQQLYLAEEIGVPQGGYINSLSFNVTGVKQRNVDIYIGTTTATTVSSWITDANFQLVYSGTAFAQTGYENNVFNFAEPYAYNGTDNIVVMVDDNTGSWSSGLAAKAHSGATNRARYVYSDGTNYNPQAPTGGTTMSNVNDIVFNICANVVSCPAPRELDLDTVTDTYAQVSWQAGGEETSWIVTYTLNNQEITETVNSTVYTISGLSNSTMYNLTFGVKAICSEEEESFEKTATFSFATPCGVVALPYEQDFDAYTTTTTVSTMSMPICWERSYTGTSTSYGVGINNATAYAVSGTNSLRFYNYYTTSTSTSYGNAYAVLPQIAANINELMVSFNVKPSTTTSYPSYFEIGVITNVEAENYDEVFQPIGAAHIVPAGGERLDIVLADYSGAAGQIAFRVTKEKPEGETRTGSYTYVYIDNLLVDYIPTCSTPSVTLEGTVATIAAGEYGTPSAYELQVNGETMTVGVNVTTVDLMQTFGLASSSHYEVSVRAICGEGDTSSWSYSTGFNTPCAAMAIPYTQDFEDYAGVAYNAAGEVPVCWDAYTTGSVAPHVIASGSGSYVYIHEGSKALTFYGNGYNYAVLPELSGNLNELQINFWMQTESASNGELTLGYITSTDSACNSFVAIETYDRHNGSMIERQTYLDNVPDTAARLVFRWYWGNQWSCCIDDIVITNIPTCYAPTTVAVDEISDMTAVVTWNTNIRNSEDVTYIVEYMAEDDTAWTVVNNLSDTTYTLTGLTPSTNYSVRVKTDCGEEDGESDYTVQTVSFTTWCISGYQNEGSSVVICPEESDFRLTAIKPIAEACFLGDPVTIEVTNLGYAETINDFTAYYQVNDEAPVREYVQLTTPLAFRESMNYTFNTIPAYAENDNYVKAWVVAGEDTIYTSIAPFYSEGVEDIENINLSIQDVDGDGYNWGLTTNSHSGNYALISSSYIGDVGGITPNNWLYLPYITLPEEDCELSWWIGAYSENYHAEHYQVGVILGDSVIYYVWNETLTTAEWSQRTVDMAAFAGQQVRIAFIHNECYDQWSLLLDDISLRTVLPEYTTYGPINTLEPIAVPYVEDFSGEVAYHGWTPYDVNNDDITMKLSNNISYEYSDELTADDWMISPCINLPAGDYTVSYEYRANSPLTESFEVFYGEGAHVEDMTVALASHTFSSTATETVTNTITITEDGTYNFGFHATSQPGNLGFTIDNFEIYPIVNVLVISDSNGTVTPDGNVAVHYGEDLTLSIVPDMYYHVAGIWVDDEQVVYEDASGANLMLYTLNNVTEPHTVYVSYKLEFHIIKTPVNYRQDLYTDFGGHFIPATTDTLIDPAPWTVTFTPDEHYFFHSFEFGLGSEEPEDMVDVTARVVNNGDGTYSYTTDSLVAANNYLHAIFRRDTVPVIYTAITGEGHANNGPLMHTGESSITWLDYAVLDDVDTTVTFSADYPYHVVEVIVNGESQGRVLDYEFVNVKDTQLVDIKYGYRIDAFVSNYNNYLDFDTIMGTITPDTQYVAEYDPMSVSGTVAEHFHLYNLFVNGVDMIESVVFTNDGHNYTFTMDSIANNYTIEAVVKLDTFAVTYHILEGQGYADASGLLTGDTTYATYYDYGSYPVINIVPGTGYSIGNVVLDGTMNLYTANNYQFNFIETTHDFDVIFVPNTYTITTNAYGNGTVSDGITFTYDPENPVDYEFIATAAEGYYIAAVVINNVEQEITNVDSFNYVIENAAENYTINAHFAMYTYTMTAEATEGGSINPVGAQTVNYGTDVTYEINADEGWYIAQTVIDGETTDYTQADALVTLEVPFTGITADHNVSVIFAQFMYTITATAGANGTVNDADAISESVAYGSNYSLTITPAANYQVADVVVDGESVGAVEFYEFINITEDHNVTVTFEATQYTLTATSNITACSIAPANVTVNAGTDVDYTLTAAAGYHLVNVIANGEEVVVTNNAFTIENVQSDYTIYANFASDNVTVTVEQPAHATITPGTQTFAYGATPSYMIVPEVGYEIDEVTAGNEVVTVTYNNGIGTFTLNPVLEDIVLTATTNVLTYTIEVTQGEHGTISPATQEDVEYGSSVTFTITPDEFYAISDVIVDGSSRGALSTFTFNNVTGNHTITAVFAEDCAVPTNLTAMNITQTSADLHWVGTASSYEVRYKAAGSANYQTQTVNTNTLTLTGLTCNTLYSWGVRAICGTLESDWAINGFTTANSIGIAETEMANVKVYSYLNNVYIVNEDGIAISNVDIYDIYGKQIYTGKVLSNTEVISLNVANGNYVVRLATENGVAVYKVAIVK